jgi:hypothetical protein
MGSTDIDTANFLGGIEGLLQLDDLQPEDMAAYVEELKNIIPQLSAFGSEGEKVNFLLEYVKNIEPGPIRDQLQSIINEAFDNLSITSTKTFTQIGDLLDDISKDLRTINGIIDEFNENGSISLDTFMDLANIMDNISLEDLGSLENGREEVDKYITALQNLHLAYDADTGAIQANAESMKSLQDIQQALTKAKLAATIKELKASQATTEMEIAYYDAQIAGAKAILQSLDALTEGEISSAELTQKASTATEQSTTGSLKNINENYQTDVVNNNQWKAAIIKNLADASQA